jgi:pimeloyl-ACP methyl ester carboxylesterase
VTVPLPEWALKPFPKVRIPTLVIWGMKDKALLPIQLEGLDELVEDLMIVRIPEAGHFVPWEAPDEVVKELVPFLAEQAGASAQAQ